MVDGNSSDSHASETDQFISIERQSPCKLLLHARNCLHMPPIIRKEADSLVGTSQGHTSAQMNDIIVAATSGGSVHESVAPQIESSTGSNRPPEGHREVLTATRPQIDQPGQAHNQDHHRLRYHRWFREGLHGPWIPGTRRNRRAVRAAIRNIQRHFP